MKLPNPGSKEAREQGCLCPVMDNNHGKFAPWPPNDWWIHEDCPLHTQECECGEGKVEE